MSIIPEEKIIKKGIKFKSKDLDGKLAQVDVSIGGGEIVSLILNNEIVLRFNIKKGKKDSFIDKLKKDSLKNFKLFIKKNRACLDDILISEEEIRANINKDKQQTLYRTSSEEKDFIGGIEIRARDIKKLGKKLGFELCKDHKESYCSSCHAFRAGSSLKLTKKDLTPSTCLKCRNILTQKSISHLPTTVFNYLKGSWLEDYIAFALQSKGWVAWSSPDLFVYGVSGYPHQVDVLAIKDGKILIVECKSSDFSQKFVKEMLAKYYDIRCHFALAVSPTSMHPDAINIIKKNPAIKYCHNIDNIKRVNELISKL